MANASTEIYTSNITTANSTEFLINIESLTGSNIAYGIGGNYLNIPSTTIKTRKSGAYRVPKKKRGDKTNANNKQNRLSVLSPVAAYSFIKKRFNFIQSRKLTKRFEAICKILAVASQNGQVALKETIEKRFGVLIREQELIACGFKYYIEEAKIQLFVERVRGKIIKLTPLKNYVRVIPKETLRIKEKADKAGLFDGYVVMHTDPNDTSVAKTEAEKRDPILFGVIKDSGRYYFVDDWIDELCDLTFDKILDDLSLDSNETNLESEKLKEKIEALVHG